MTSNTPETQALLPCLVEGCSSKPRVQWQGAVAYVECAICGDTGPLGWTEDEAVAGWNARHRISHSLPGDDAAQVKAVMSILWKREQYNGVGPDYDNYRPGSKFDMGGRVERYEKEARDIIAALAALTPSALSGDAGENYRDCVEAALAPARQWWGGGEHGSDHIYLINNMMADLRVFHAPQASPPTDELGEIERLRAEIDGYRKLTRVQQSRIGKMEGALMARPPIKPDDGSWWYPEGDTSSDACCHGPYEALEGAADEMDEGESRVVVLERALSLPDVYAALHVFTDAEKDARDDDEPWDFTLHASLEEARAALPSHQGVGEP